MQGMQGGLTIRIIILISEVVIETECDITAIEHQATVAVVTCFKSCVVGAFVTEITEFCHQRETLSEIESNAGLEAYIPYY